MSTQLTIPCINQPGELARIARTLAAKKVNITAIAGEGLGEAGVVRLVVSDPAKAAAALRRAGFRVHVSPVVAVPMPNRPGELAKVCRKLAAKKVNIQSVYGSAAGWLPEIIFHVSDTAKARQILKAR